MISHGMSDRLELRSAIRESYELACRMEAELGPGEVFDLSIGNPTAPVPEEVSSALKESAQLTAGFDHGYMSSAGYEYVRDKIADSLNARFNADYSREDLIMTTGAACAINIAMQTILDPGDEIVVFKPYYPAYRAFALNWGARVVEVDFDPQTMLPDIQSFEAALTPKTRMVIVNTPNNPSGVIYPSSIAHMIVNVLDKACAAFGQAIYLLSDEPYRELAYEGRANPWWPSLYKDVFVVYSFSKSGSVAGERIGYLALTPGMDSHDLIFRGACRSLGDLGFVNAPATAQRIAAHCLDSTIALEYYDSSRRVLIKSLGELGFSFIQPEGAFYLMLKAPDNDEHGLISALASHGIIVVSGAEFGAPGYVRVSYCLPPERIRESISRFELAARDLGLVGTIRKNEDE